MPSYAKKRYEEEHEKNSTWEKWQDEFVGSRYNDRTTVIQLDTHTRTLTRIRIAIVYTYSSSRFEATSRIRRIAGQRQNIFLLAALAPSLPPISFIPLQSCQQQEKNKAKNNKQSVKATHIFVGVNGRRFCKSNFH